MRMTARTHILGVFVLLFAACEQPRLLAPRDLPDSDDGRIAWRITEYPGRGTPGYLGDVVYFTARDHSVVAVQRESGGIVWVTKLPVAAPEYRGAGLVVAGGVIVVGDDTDVFGLDPTSGSILWHFAPPGVRLPGLILPTAAGPNVIVTSSTGHLFSVVAANGAINWVTRVGDDDDLRIFSPIVRGNDIFVSFTQGIISQAHRGGVARVDLDDGDIRWWRYLPDTSDTSPGALTIAPALAGNVFAAGSRDGPTFGFDVSDGKLKWMLATAPELLTGPAAPLQERAPVASNDELIFVRSSMGRVRAVDPATGTVVWERPPDFGGTGWMAADSSHLAIVFPLGDMQLVSAADGVLDFHLVQDSFVARMTPLLTDDRIYVSGLYGLYAVKR